MFPRKVKPSGGERTRLSLGKLLQAEAGSAVDGRTHQPSGFEPIEWLQDYLTDYRAPALISHAVFFSDHVCSTMGR
jgi:ATPase subunit of ABC transporter with duplicated ATPase domains